MKQLLILTTILYVHVPAIAQPLSTDALLDMVACNKYSCVNEKATTDGYKVVMNKEQKDYNVYKFQSNTTYKNGSNPELIGPYRLRYTQRPKDSSIAINYTVGNKEERDFLLSAFREKGYEYLNATKTESEYDNDAIIYQSAVYPDIRLKITDYEKTFKGKKYLEYDFELMRTTRHTAKKKMEDNPLEVH